MLQVTLDEAARSVRLVSADGWIARYDNGARGPICAFQPGEPSPECPFADEFVILRSDEVEVGFRSPDDGALEHLAYFQRAAFQNPRLPCVWRSLWNFRVG